MTKKFLGWFWYLIKNWEKIHDWLIRTQTNFFLFQFLVCLFGTRRAVVIARSSLLLSLSCKKFINVANYSKSIEGINTKLGFLAHHDKVQLQNKGCNSKSYNFGVMPLFNKNFLSRMIAPGKQALVPNGVLLLNFCNFQLGFFL